MNLTWDKLGTNLGQNMKLGDPHGKKEISKAFRLLEKYGCKVFNFSANKRLSSGMKDFVDYVVLGRSKVYFVELKIGKDDFSEGQLGTKGHLLKIGGNVRYHIATEKNYKTIIDLILGDL